uniref:Zinc finger protein n=1 Tax=Ciona intestinalis TaxID=7719 RepID=Q1RPX5_CIOIN|nr:zinc finger protein [Ciona intestinalis]XP_009861334.1 zinc finger protein isoform X1 [Ciona intestinalis]BAE93310.1 zinc finger protein [Ciona intestinalis]|eukprot:NP_001071917.1 zinc finger protein [Ciona intestinalis]
MELNLSDNEEHSPFKLRRFLTPLGQFRPRRFSSPLPKKLHLFDDVADAKPRDESCSTLFDSGIGSTFADYDAPDKPRQCPPSITWSTNDENILTSSAGNDDEIARNLTKLALQFQKYTPSGKQWHQPALKQRKQTTPHHFETESGKYDDKTEYFTPGIKSTDFVTGDDNSFDADFSAVVGSASKRKNASSKFKTKPCTTYYTIGTCPYGDKCNFYHTEDEKNSTRVKTRLCKSWNSSGACEYGERCDFAHGSEELVVKYKTRMCKIFQATGRCPYGTQCTFAHYEREKRKDISTVYKFKTEMCQLWLNNKCVFGAACHFAHGAEEMKIPLESNEN